MKVGDLVEKTGPFDTGKVGVVLEINDNGLGNVFAQVLLPGGNITTWYTDLVKVVDKDSFEVSNENR